jgi:hypothetical protein
LRFLTEAQQTGAPLVFSAEEIHEHHDPLRGLPTEVLRQAVLIRESQVLLKALQKRSRAAPAWRAGPAASELSQRPVAAGHSEAIRSI